jgi:hypothetical protein
VAMEVDPNCRETLNDMAAGSLGALMHGSTDCLPNKKKLPVFWPYGKPPGENWQAAAPAPAPATAKAVGEPQELAQVEGGRRGEEDEEVKDIKALLAGSQKLKREPDGRADRRGEVKVLEKDVLQATASEKKAVVQDVGLRRQVASANGVEGDLKMKLKALETRTAHEEAQMTLVQEKEAEMVLRQKALIGKLSSQLSQAKGEADKLKRQDALKRLALKRLHSAFEHGEAEVEQTARSQGGGNNL